MPTGIRSNLRKLSSFGRLGGLLAQWSLPCTVQNEPFCDLVAFVLLGDML